ncbi:MAG: AmmeMemoRadiSam system protein B [Gammaproteobacteria bacterium]|nr:AmmeMemoRadiSam system protein B [Gammaproteobacteria bacterium]
MEVRQPAVAGTFYQDSPDRLRLDLGNMLEDADSPALDPFAIKALIVPHAGYVYSGPVAATAYKLLEPRRHQIKRVVLLGPSHHVPLTGMAAPKSKVFRTPLGDIPVDQGAINSISGLPGVVLRDDAHAGEHSLEVQLPFLQWVLDDFVLIPLVVGHADSETVATVLEQLWGGEETLIVISSDLSHFLPYTAAKSSDSDTSELITHLSDTIVGEQACGCHPLNGLLKLARSKGLTVSTLDLRNSGDTAGTRDQVVGYGSYAVYR